MRDPFDRFVRTPPDGGRLWSFRWAFFAWALVCGLAMSPTPAPAQSSWTNASGTSMLGGYWTNATYWSNGVPNGVGTTAIFGGSGSAPTITNDVAITNSAILFSATSAAGYTILSNGTAGILYLKGNGGSALIQAGANAGGPSFSIPLVMLSDLVVSNLLTSGRILTIYGSLTNSGFGLTLEDSGITTISGPISGTGGLTKNGTGVLTLSSSAGNTYSGGTLVSAGTLQVNTAGGIQGGVTNNSSVVYYGSGSGIYGGVMSGSGSLIISNTSASYSLFLTNQNTLTGSILVEQGNLGFSNASGSANAASGISILSGTSLILDNRSVSNFNRIANVPLTMQGATLLVLGGGTNNVGTITFGTGGSVISNVVSLISTPTLSRGTGFATVNFTGGGTNLFATQAGSSNAILPWAFINGADFATHDGNGTALRAFTNSSTTFAADANVKATNVTTVSGMTINSLVLGTNLTLTSNDQTLTNTSGGMILTRSGQFITNGSLRFSVEAIVENENAATVYSTLVTPSGLTKTGAGTLTLLGTNQNAGGTLRVNQGSFTVGEGGVVNGGDVLVNVGTFNMNGGAATLNSLVVTNATPGTTAILTLGYGTLTTTNGVILNNNASPFVGGVAGKTMTWNMLGGTNITGTAGNALTIGGMASSFNTGVVVVAGPTTVWSNGMALWLGGNNANNQTNSVGSLMISNGAVVYVTGTGSTTFGLVVGQQGAGSSLTLADGGKLYYTGANSFSVGASTTSSNNTILVTGLGSILNTTTNRGINMGTKNTGGGGNQITVASNAKVITAGLAMGGAFNDSGRSTGNDGGIGSNNTVLVYGSGTLWSNANGASAVFVGFSGAGNRLIVSNNALFSSMGALTVAAAAGGTSNQLLVLDGGQVTAASVTIGSAANASSNLVQVSGSNSRLISSGTLNLGASSGSGNQLLIQNSGLVVSAGTTFGGTAAASANSFSNMVVVSSGSVWSNLATIAIGTRQSYGQQVLVTNGGTLYSAGTVQVGSANSNFNNRLVVSDPGSLVNILSSNIVLVGAGNTGNAFGNGNAIIVTNGGTFLAGGVVVGIGVASSNSLFLVSGAGSLAQLARGVSVGSNGAGFASTTPSGSASILVNDRGVLEANEMEAGYNGSGTISNLGGIYQFTTNAPIITPNTAGAIVLNNGTISFRGITNADVMGSLGSNGLKNISYSGANTFRLNNASNFTAGLQNYTFGYSSANPSNYAGLEMINGGTAWKSAWLAISNNGSMLVSNTSASIQGVLTNSGQITIANATATYASNVVLIAGTYLSQGGATNNFNGGLNVGSSGNLTVSNGVSVLGGTYLTNSGTVQVMGGSTANWQSNVVLSGGNYLSQGGATNNFNGGATITTGGEFSMTNGASVVSVGSGVLTNNGIFDIEGSGIYNPATGTIATGSGLLRVLSGGALNLSNGVFTLANVITNQGAVNVFQSSATYASNVVLASGSSYTSKSGTNAFNGGLQILSGAGYNLDILSQISGTVANNGLFSILNGAAYTFTNGSYFSGNGALLVGLGGRLNLTNGTFAAFGGMGMTNDGRLNVQNLGILNFTNNAAMPHGSGTAQVDHGGILNFTNGTFAFGNTLTNAGTVNVVNSRVTYAAPVVISGGYISDPSTNTFATNVTVTGSGYLVGGLVVSNGDQFVFEKDLLMFSTNKQFSLSSAAVLFTNSANHLLSISNSGALNIGQGYASFAQVASNFAIGTLSIASGNRMTLSGLTNGPVTNALYVGWLDIQGWSTNSGYTSVTNSLLLALNLPDVNLYYNKYDERNQWLNDFIPNTGYDLWGGGLLLPIPEPSPFLAVGAGLALLAFLRRRKGA